MTIKQLLRQIIRRIVAAFTPEQIILFGSYAYGEPTADSDLDLLVVTNRLRHKSISERTRLLAQVGDPRSAVEDPRSAAERAERAESAARPDHVAMDLLVRTPAELAHRLSIGDPFFREVVFKGRVLYRRPGTRYHFRTPKWREHMPEPELVAEWAQKAEGDYDDALQILRRRKRPNPSSVCYHCQQCAEKYLKAFLLKHGVTFEWTHSLSDLNKSCAKVDSSFLFIANWLKALDAYATDTRYPGRVFEIEEARAAVVTIKKIRKFIRARLGLESETLGAQSKILGAQQRGRRE